MVKISNILVKISKILVKLSKMLVELLNNLFKVYQSSIEISIIWVNKLKLLTKSRTL